MIRSLQPCFVFGWTLNSKNNDSFIVVYTVWLWVSRSVATIVIHLLVIALILSCFPLSRGFEEV